jgi:hypothetical protein
LGVSVPKTDSPVAADVEAVLYDWHNVHMLQEQRADAAYWARVFEGARSLAVLGAGTGRVIAGLRRCGMRGRLVAIDRSVARLARVPDDLDVERVEGDFRRLSDVPTVDAVLFPYSAFQLLGTAEDRTLAISTAAAMLTRGGLCGIDVSTSFDKRPSHDWELLLRARCEEVGATVEEWQHVAQRPDHVIIRQRYRIGSVEVGEVTDRWVHHRRLRIPELLLAAGLVPDRVERGYGWGVAPQRRAYLGRVSPSSGSRKKACVGGLLTRPATRPAEG